MTADEIFETKTEGVKIHSLMVSRRILGDKGVDGVEFVRTRPGELRPDGKREVTPIEGSEFILPADAVIVAIGAKQIEPNVPIDEKMKCFNAWDVMTRKEFISGI